MKNFLITLLLTLTLIVLFSFIDLPVDSTTPRGSGTRVKGNFGVIIPGDGADQVEAVPKIEPMEEIPQAEQIEEKERTDMFKIAYGAGHNNFTANGIPTELHSPKVNEWQLNDKVARYFAEAASQYEDVELLRVDDPQGVQPVDLFARCVTANNYDADFFLAIHHNGLTGIPWNGGGLVAFSYPGSAKGAVYRDAIYDACIAAGGIVGDRAQSKIEKGYDVLRYTNAPAVLMEYGFMDSRVDAPIILTDAYAKNMAYATMEGIAKVADLKKKAATEAPAPEQAAELKDAVYRVQLGDFRDPADAKALLDRVRAAGFEASITVQGVIT